ncbi:MAG: sensor histidine kinase [Candidatus Sumerlaeia bacterium]
MSRQTQENPQRIEGKQQELFLRLGWFIQLRWVAVAIILVGLVYAHWLYGPNCVLIDALFPMACLVASYNLFFAAINYRLRNVWKPSGWKNEAFAWLQILVDMVMLTIALHLTGGIESAFIVFYMVHLVIASALLPRFQAFAIALIASALLDTVVYLEYRGMLPHFYYRGLSFGSADGPNALPEMLVNLCVIYNAAFFLTVYVASSISNRLRLRSRELRQVNRQLSQVNSMKSEFMRMASHEMRSPVMAVKGLLSLVERRTNQSAECQDCREYILRCRNRLDAMQDLINDLLDYSKLQSPNQQTVFEAFQMSAIIAAVASDMEPAATSSQIQYEVSIESPCPISGNQEQIEIMAKNLINNAIRYTPAGGDVKVRLFEEDGKAVLQVIDTGIGIDEEAQRNIFQEFYRAQNAKEYEAGGTGLGLTLSHDIARQHGGSIRVESRPDHGATFIVEIPLAPIEQG